MINFIINRIKLNQERKNSQAKLNAIFGKISGSDSIKLTLPKKYIPMIELIAKLGIEDRDQLLNFIKKQEWKSFSFEEVEKIWNAAENHFKHISGEICKGDIAYKENIPDLEEYFVLNYVLKIQNNYKNEKGYLEVYIRGKQYNY